jgi:hypothetical protein
LAAVAASETLFYGTPVKAANAINIARETGLPVQRVYVILKELIALGCVQLLFPRGSKNCKMFTTDVSMLETFFRGGRPITVIRRNTDGQKLGGSSDGSSP